MGIYLIQDSVSNWYRNADRANVMVAIGVWLTVFVAYLLTKAATMTFWDCGEFIACCHILGVPHPPGTPLYVLIGRLFAILPLFSDAAARTNFLSVAGSSFAALFAYLCGVRVLRPWFAKSESRYKRLLIYAGAASGTFFLAFSKTQWGNSIETEVYSLAMLMFFVILWLTLVYYQRPESRQSERVMLAVIYLSFLSIAVHMATFPVLPVCALFFILKRETPLRYWILTAGVILFELYLIFALSSGPGEVPFYVPALIVFVIYLLYVFSLERSPRATIWFMIGYLVTIAPVYQHLYRSITRSGSAESGNSLMLNAIGLVGFAGLVTLAVVTFLKYRRSSASQRGIDQPLLVSSVLVACAAVAALIPLVGIRGYAAFLFLSVMVLLGLGAFLSKYVKWPVLIAIAGVSLIIMGVYPFLYGMLGTLIVAGVMTVVSPQSSQWRSAILIVVVAALGFSAHAYLPIRSSQKPMIDQTATSQGIKTTIAFLDRKQYTSEPMTQRMFHRRGEWKNQFGNYQRMGFWHFFSDQFGLTGSRFLVLFLLGIVGLWEAIRRAPQAGLAVTLLAIICSIGLVLYMNFADGTRQNPTTGQDYIEVRDRDYFFTPAYLLFGLAMGFGATTIIRYVWEAVASFARATRTVVVACSMLLFLLPIYALAGNYWECDRSRNYIAYDYARNLLGSADPNAVLFTYGDNDTFPLWAVQEGFGFRKDVCVVNLSLAGTKWYIKQVRDNMHVDLGLTDAQIDRMRPYRRPDGRTFDIYDQVIDAIIDHNPARRSIEYATTVPQSHRRYHGGPVDSHLLFEGMVWRFRDSATTMRLDVDSSYAFFMDTTRFRARGLRDSTLFKDGNMIRLTSAYLDGFVIVGDSLRNVGRLDEAEKLLRYGVETLTPSEELANTLGLVYIEQKRADKLEQLVKDVQGESKKSITVQLAYAKRQAGDVVGAEALLNQLFLSNPTYRPAFEELARLYNETSQYTNLKAVLQIWLQANPNDNDVRSMLQELEQVGQQRGIADTVKK